MSNPKTTPAQKKKIRKVMHEFKVGELNIGKSKKKVQSRKQAVATAISEVGKTQKDGFHIPEVNPEIYISGVLDGVRTDARKRIYVKNPKVRGGGYYRMQDVKDPPPEAAAPKTPRVTTAGSSKQASPKKTIAVLAGGALTAAAIGAAALYVKSWHDSQSIDRTVQGAKSYVDKRVAQEQKKLGEAKETISTLSKQVGGLSTKRQQLETENEYLKSDLAALKIEKNKIEIDQIRQIQDLTKSHQTSLEEAKRVHESQLSAIQKSQSSETVKAQRVVAAARKRIEDEYKTQLADTQKKHEAELNSAVETERTKLTEQHQGAIAAMETEYQKKAKTLEDQHADRLKELETSHQTRTAELETEFQHRTVELEESFKTRSADMEKRYEQRVKDAEKKAERELKTRTAEMQRTTATELESRTNEMRTQLQKEAADQILSEREASMQMAQNEIRKATLPQPKSKGAIAYNGKDGISLEASAAQEDFDLNVMQPSALKQRVTKAVGGMVSERMSEGMSSLALGLRDRFNEIKNMGGEPKTPKAAQQVANIRWEAMQQALNKQARREAMMADGLDEVKSKYTDQHQQLLEQLQSAARDGGGYSPELLRRFDDESRKMTKKMQKEIDKILGDIPKQIKLDADRVQRMYDDAFRDYLRTV